MLIGAVVLLSLWGVASVVFLRRLYRDSSHWNEQAREKSGALSTLRELHRKLESDAAETFCENLTLKQKNADLQQQLFSEIARLAAAEAALKTPPMTDYFKD